MLNCYYSFYNLRIYELRELSEMLKIISSTETMLYDYLAFQRMVGLFGKFAINKISKCINIFITYYNLFIFIAIPRIPLMSIIFYGF